MSDEKRYRVLIVDDDEMHLRKLKRHLEEAFVDKRLFGGAAPQVETESDARNIESLIRARSPEAGLPYDVILADVFMPLDPDKDSTPHPEGGAVRVYRAIKDTRLHEAVFLVVMTNRGSLAQPELDKIRAEQKEYSVPWVITQYPKPETTSGPAPLEKLLTPDDWKYAIGRAIGCCKDRDWKETFVRGTLEGIVGNSRLLTEAKLQAERCGRDNERLVVITGETGSGKELIAQAVHRHSRRSKGGTLDKFRAVDCGNLDGQTVISELFGHEKGAFTSANSAAQGIFEQMQDGTIFLDEFGSNLTTALMLDQRLRRLLSSWDFQRMQGTCVLYFKGTVILGGSKLDSLLKSGEMPPDFVSRVGEAPRIDVAPLRERRADIAPLAEFFLRRACTARQKTEMRLTREANDLLQAYSWAEGNVRQLERMMEHLSRLLKVEIGVEDLPEKVRTRSDPAPKSASVRHEHTPEEVRQALKATDGNRTQAACLLDEIPKRASQKEKDAARNRLNESIERFCFADPTFGSSIPPSRPKGGRPQK